MANTRSDCIQAVVASGLDVRDATDIVDGILADKARLEAQTNLTNPTQQLTESFTKQMDQARRSAALQRRHASINIIKRDQLDKFLTQVKYEGFTLLDGLEAQMVGSVKDFTGARQSAMSRRWGILNSWIGPMVNDLEAIDGALPLLRSDMEFSYQVMREMRDPGSTGDKVAREVAQVFSDYSEVARQRLNNAGADIGKLDNWSPQSHDPILLLSKERGGMDAWVNYMTEHLDLERSFPEIANDTESVKRALRDTFLNITTGRKAGAIGPSDGRVVAGPRNLANRLGKERVLHFKDADSAVDYHRQYGKGNIVNAMFLNLEFSARQASLLETFGPNPELMIKSIIKKEINDIGANGDFSPEEKRKAISALTSAWKDGTVTSGKLARWYTELNGETYSAVNQKAARVGSTVRGLQSLTKLGGATLSAIADVPVKATAIRHRGNNLFQSWNKAVFGTLFEGRTSEEKKMIARQLGAFIDGTMQEINSRFCATDHFSGAMSNAMNKFFKWSGLTGWTEAHKAGFIYGLANDLGENAAHSLADMNQHLAAVLRRHGVDDTQWDAIRHMVEKMPDGRQSIVPERAHLIPESALVNLLPENMRSTITPKGKNKAKYRAARRSAIDRARHDLESRVMGLYADECRYAIIEPDDRTRAALVWGTRPGTWAGETIRLLMQFKSFPITYANRVLREGRWKKAGERGFQANTMGLTHFVTAMWTFGYLSMTAKDLSKGREPKNPEKWETWVAALLQSGGAGIYGDLLFAKVNRAGNSLAGTLAGPTVGTADRAFRVVQNFIHGDVEDAGADALRFAMDNTPLLNLWYTRAAADYLLLFHLREMLSPGSLRRTERTLKREYDQEYIVPPSSVIKRGGFGYK